MLTLTEAADRLGLAASSLRHQVRNGKLRATKRGRDLFVTEREVERYRRESRSTSRRCIVSVRYSGAGMRGRTGQCAGRGTVERTVLTFGGPDRVELVCNRHADMSDRGISLYHAG